MKKLKIINFKEWIVIFWKSDKIFKKNKEVGYKKIVEYVNSNNEFEIRVGLVLLLNYYIEPKYLNDIFKICDSINNKKYYCKMAIAWLISICY